MGRPRISDTQITLRITAAVVPRLDALAKQLAPPGVTVTRADAMRAAVAKGLEVYEAERRGKRGSKS